MHTLPKWLARYIEKVPFCGRADRAFAQLSDDAQEELLEKMRDGTPRHPPARWRERLCFWKQRRRKTDGDWEQEVAAPTEETEEEAALLQQEAPTEFAAWLIHEMKSRDWDILRLARETGISRTTVQLILQNLRPPNPKFCEAFANALDVPFEDVIEIAGLWRRPAGYRPKRQAK